MITPRITIGDIAQKLNVHQSTVSRALKNDRRISKKTRDKVLEIARAMNYRPDPMLASLVSYRKSRSHRSYQSTLGWITNYPTRTGWREFERLAYFRGINRRADELGFKLEEFWLCEPGMTQARMTQILMTRNIQGLFFSQQPRSRAHLSLDWSKFSAISLGHNLAQPAFHTVGIDHFRAFSTLMRRLKQLGYRRPGFAVWPLIHEMTDRKWAAAFSAYQPVPSQEQIPIFLNEKWTISNFKKWLLIHRPDVVISHDETLLDWIEELGFQVPADIGFVLAAKHAEFSSRCSGMDENSDFAAETATNILADMINRGESGIPDNPISTSIEGRWIEGATLQRMNM